MVSKWTYHNAIRTLGSVGIAAWKGECWSQYERYSPALQHSSPLGLRHSEHESEHTQETGVYLAEVGSVYDVYVKCLRHQAVVPPVIVFVLREGVDWLNGWELLFLGAG